MITIGIINYNKASLIGSCIQSCIAQNTPVNIIIIDNGSSDNSDEVIKSTINKHSNIEYIRNSSNKGVAAAKNQILAKVKTPYVLFVDGDDLLYFTAIENYLNAIKRYPDIAVFYSDYDVHDMVGNQTTREFTHPYDARLLMHVPYIHANSCFNVQNLKQIGGFDEKIWGGENYKACLLLSKEYLFYHVCKALFMYRIDGNNFHYLNRHIVGTNIQKIKQDIYVNKTA